MLYIIFAVTTALAAAITLMKPVLKRLAVTSPTNTLIEYRFITYLVFTILATVMAPFLLIPTIIPSLNLVFQDSFYESVKD